MDLNPPFGGQTVNIAVYIEIVRSGMTDRNTYAALYADLEQQAVQSTNIQHNHCRKQHKTQQKDNSFIENGRMLVCSLFLCTLIKKATFWEFNFGSCSNSNVHKHISNLS